VDGKAIVREDLQAYFEHLTHVNLPLFLRMLERAGEHSAEDLLGEVDVPALVVAGEKDSFTPPDYARALADGLPKGELVVLPGGTHVAPLEQHESLNLRVIQFIDRLAGAPA
jgi:pimeloyl-ACP methyl ester carboxylesterase